ncbi:2-amino-4-hydroxy-6-hydroxymethyldihydropteridine diphosphokinase [Flavobacterium cyanobacteriorum]|uniref:2-amino-4-hydroxy-6-hydroxymethyldihydropteridine pyrophosphokinase n=1 Tax=Flavobacterium cyanobacteriorum TaxID=2022802 RepID=A0A255ZA22_9FLAO|nr:2-amino-4-hydroxy-6-hydroxymethyldihydropteridine diphosphokinase [Flavobacterium cyanobacteriorum]OYQ37470.1 2-amino-4-hydroxy-6-hydroxymethyldihydropteridine diphosphokinase [Flavobacterium cyanobacteriorum]
MKFQNEAILSLGSNSGNRLQHITSCISYIHNHIATVVSVSAVYETPSWGFKGDDFYNCAVTVHTCLPARALLAALLEAERHMGRERSGSGYSARTIDIDIISFNDSMIDEISLQVPHPRMHERKFVLYPLRDIKPGWIHPVLKKNVGTLIAETTDSAAIKHAATLEAPMAGLRLNRYNYIAIEGNIGAGKTTLSGKISEDFNAKLVLERFADNPFLPKFYKDQARYAFSLEMSFLADRYQQLTDDLSQFDLFRDFVVADYHIFKSLIFSKVTLTEDEYRLYRKLFDIIYREIPRPGLYIYLYQDTQRLLQHIKKRGRSYEQDIDADYLEKINKGYLDFIKTEAGRNVLILDVSGRDFVNSQADYIWILSQVAKVKGPD